MSEHTTFLGKLIAAIGGFFAHLVTGAKNAFEELAPEQQDNLIHGVGVAQILKESFSKGEDFVLNEIAKLTGFSVDVARATVLAIAKDRGIDTTSVQDFLDHLSDKVETIVTDNGWAALWQDIAKFAASYFSDKKLDWVSLSIGLIEFAYQKVFKNK